VYGKWVSLDDVDTWSESDNKTRQSFSKHFQVQAGLILSQGYVPENRDAHQTYEIPVSNSAFPVGQGIDNLILYNG